MRKNNKVFIKNYLAFCMDTTYSFIIGITFDLFLLGCIELVAHDFALSLIQLRATSLGAAVSYFFSYWKYWFDKRKW